MIAGMSGVIEWKSLLGINQLATDKFGLLQAVVESVACPLNYAVDPLHEDGR